MAWVIDFSFVYIQIVICGTGKNFCAGIDLEYLQQMLQSLNAISCPGRMREEFRRHILKLQVSGCPRNSY
jgi:enoyl-CoA hydratase/carnithine racemase